MPFEIESSAGRDCDFTINLMLADGINPVDLESGNVVRAKLFRNGTNYLDISSNTGEDGTLVGSFFTIAEYGQNQVNLRLAAGDTATLWPGVYRLEIDVVDTGDSQGRANPTKPCDFGIVHICDNGGGATGT
ncbi:MAG TPA: hypothetical protein VG826_29535 [Pirellulales bacterium]|nr:hypothetical protein [Pirellulales bacterium]